MPPSSGRTMSEDYDYLFKVVVVGDSHVGKTCFLLRLTENYFREYHMTTIGVDFKIKTLEVGKHRVKACIWDTAGTERFRTISSCYYRGSHCLVVAFDLTDRTTFNNVSQWLEEVDHNGGRAASKLLIGTKSDLCQQRVVESNEAMEFAKSREMLYAEISSKSGQQVEECFAALISEQLVRETGSVTGPEIQKGVITLGTGTDVNQGWCTSCSGLGYGP